MPTDITYVVYGQDYITYVVQHYLYCTYIILFTRCIISHMWYKMLRLALVMCSRPLFRKFSQELDTTADFVIYKAESSRMCEEEIIKQLQDLRRSVIFVSSSPLPLVTAATLLTAICLMVCLQRGVTHKVMGGFP